jgi:hypothetical protein
MGYDDGHRAGSDTTLMDEMNCLLVDRRHKLRELVKPSFLPPPIEPVSPVIDEPAHEGEACAVVPTFIVDRARPTYRR